MHPAREPSPGQSRSRRPVVGKNGLFVAAAALALLIIIPKLLVFGVAGVEQALIGTLLAVERGILSFLFVSLRYVSSSHSSLLTGDAGFTMPSTCMD